MFSSGAKVWFGLVIRVIMLKRSAEVVCLRWFSIRFSFIRSVIIKVNSL